MLKQDLNELTDDEQRVLRDAFHEGTHPRRVRGVVLSALVVIVGVTLFLIYGVGSVFLAGLTIVTVVVASIEKLTYQRWMLRYESVIRKLSNRVEGLEGVPLTTRVAPEAPASVRVTDQRDTHDAAGSVGSQQHTGPSRHAS